MLLSCAYDIYAAHQLSRADWDDAKNRSVFGHCANLHGHQYKLEVNLEGTLDNDSGMMVNGYEVDRIIKEKVLSLLDHQFINDVDPFFKTHLTTVEWISFWIFEKLKSAFPANCSLKSIRLYETPNLFATYAG